MNICLGKRRPDHIGGGWTFSDNLIAGLAHKVNFTDIGNCDIFLIPGPTMVERAEVEEARKRGKKIILRADNIPRQSRNRGTGTTRLYEFAQLADMVIYQSYWAKTYLEPFIKRDGIVIYNGADPNIFTPDGPKFGRDRKTVYLYSRYSRDENKRWEEAAYYFHQYWLMDQDSEFWILGKYSDDLRKYNFDFFMDEPFKYWPPVSEKILIAQLLRSADVLLFPYYNDACSNTLIEARLSGITIDFCFSGNTGGSPEIMELPKEELTIDYMCDNYLKAFELLA